MLNVQFFPRLDKMGGSQSTVDKPKEALPKGFEREVVVIPVDPSRQAEAAFECKYSKIRLKFTFTMFAVRLCILEGYLFLF